MHLRFPKKRFKCNERVHVFKKYQLIPFNYFLFIKISKVILNIQGAKGVSHVPIHEVETIIPSTKKLWNTESIYVEFSVGMDVLPRHLLDITICHSPCKIIVKNPGKNKNISQTIVLFQNILDQLKQNYKCSTIFFHIYHLNQ